MNKDQLRLLALNALIEHELTDFTALVFPPSANINSQVTEVWAYNDDLNAAAPYKVTIGKTGRVYVWARAPNGALSWIMHEKPRKA